MWGELEKIANKQAKLLPLIFGKWDLLTRPLLSDIFPPLLKLTFDSLWEDVLQPLLGSQSELHESELAGAEEDLRLMIYEYFFSPERFEKHGGRWRRE